ncbi:MAG: DUF192 domain-containing protein [Solirubrobacteraceae bacterium]
MPPAPLPRRLSRLPAARPARPGLDVRVARTPAARLAGLAGLAEIPEHAGLLLPCTRSVHTFGMCVAIDLVWLGPGRIAVRVDAAVAPGRVRSCRRAHAVLELAAGAAARHGLHPGAAL